MCNLEYHSNSETSYTQGCHSYEGRFIVFGVQPIHRLCTLLENTTTNIKYHDSNTSTNNVPVLDRVGMITSYRWMICDRIFTDCVLHVLSEKETPLIPTTLTDYL